MKIHSLYYKNLLQGWELEEVHFSDLNVLVGISGAGKTQIVNAIQNLAEIANGKSAYTYQMTWKISFSVGKEKYLWEGEVNYENVFIIKVSEKLILNEIEIAKQESGKINYQGQILPKLGEGESLLKLLSEPDIETARKGFQAIIHKDYRNYKEETISFEILSKSKHGYLLSDIRNSKLPLIAKWVIVTGQFPQITAQIKQDFIEIFPEVEDVYVDSSFGNNEKMIEVFLKVHAKYGIITQSEISSGMFRTLMAIVELYLCHEESLFLLDEFENSLGFNCLDKMFELIENKAYSGENQFILTTHNPYIIRNTDLAAIKIVTRKGNKIIVKNAIDMGLAESAQDNFFKIINLKEFREGVSA